MNPNKSTYQNFIDGKVFGFDLGTGSIARCVRVGKELIDVDDLIFDSQTYKLEDRRKNRRPRRSIRNRDSRREDFADELEKIGLPAAFSISSDGNAFVKVGCEGVNNPIKLRCQALKGRPIKAQLLHAALSHLFKRRGKIQLPWEKETDKAKKKPEKEEWGKGTIPPERVSKEFEKTKAKYAHPATYLRAIEVQWHWDRRKALRAGNPLESILGKPQQRRRVWPSTYLEAEFRAIVEAQKSNFPALAKNADWLLYGETNEIKGHGATSHVFFKTEADKYRGVYGLRYARFNNRNPGLDAFEPVDEEGRPLHVVGKDSDAFRHAQLAVALLNFRVQDPKTRRKIKVEDNPEWLTKLIEMARDAAGEKNEDAEETAIPKSVLKKWEKHFAGKFQLRDGQTALTARASGGRARFSSKTLKLISELVGKGKPLPLLAPVLRRKNEKDNLEALNRYLMEIRNPLVRHRLTQFARLFKAMLENPKIGRPDFIVVEAIRSLAMSDNEKSKHSALQSHREGENDKAFAFWRGAGISSPGNRRIQAHKLWIETDKTCPYCLQPTDLLRLQLEDEDSQETDTKNAVEIEHIVPKSKIVCNEFYNLTLAHRDCNNVKRDQTPFGAFSKHNDPNRPTWNELSKKWHQWFTKTISITYDYRIKGMGKPIKKSEEIMVSKGKLDLFMSEDAISLVNSKGDISQTSYITKLVRQICCLLMDSPEDPWLTKDGRDPKYETGNNPQTRYQITNGTVTDALRRQWGIGKKNRGDYRHHAEDAVIVACTYPPLARCLYDEVQKADERGWWKYDIKTRRQLVENPIFGENEKMRQAVKKKLEKLIVRHHVQRKRRGNKLKTTLLSKRNYNGREVFVARKRLEDLTANDFDKIVSSHLRDYLKEAWAEWQTDQPSVSQDAEPTEAEDDGEDTETKKPKAKKLPKDFIVSLRDPIWKTPIKSVKYIQEQSRASVMKIREYAENKQGRHEIFVAYSENQEVRLYEEKSGTGFIAVPVRPCYPKGNGPAVPQAAGKLKLTIRRNDLFSIKSNVKIGRKEIEPGVYRVLMLPGEADLRIRFLPHYQHANPPKGGKVTPLRTDVCKLAPFIEMLPKNLNELPHPPSVKP
jgi:5-methylcytosine-specific restriction endonuclease McrA